MDEIGQGMRVNSELNLDRVEMRTMDEETVVLLKSGNLEDDVDDVNEIYPGISSTKSENIIDEKQIEKEKEKKPKKVRLVALDILRGITVFCMIIVNNQPIEPCYWPLGHADFNGITPTDFIFPFFLFIMGYAMGIVFSRRVQEPNRIVRKWRLCPMKQSTSHEISKWLRIIRRTVLLFLFGFFASVISHLFDFTTVRVPGVLQRISICYFLISLLLNLVPWFCTQLVIIINLHLIYVFFMFFFPTPGCGAGVVTPECSAEGYFDVLIFGKSHIYYKTKYFDPEGILSTLTSLSTAYLGVIFFKISRIPRKGDTYHLITLWMVFSVLLVGIGIILNDFVFPWNKHIWSSAFVFVTAGAAGMILSCLTWIADVNKYKCWAQLFLWVGVNPLFMYIVPSYVAIFLMKIPIRHVDPEISILYNWLFYKLFVSWIGYIKLSDMLFGLVFEFLFIPFAAIFYWFGFYIKL